MSQKALEALQREYPIKLNERRGRKLVDANSQQTDPTQAVVTQSESAQRHIDHFFQLFASGAMEQGLAQCPPSLQAHLIDEIKTGITLLEEFISKNNIIEVNPVN